MNPNILITIAGLAAAWYYRDQIMAVFQGGNANAAQGDSPATNNGADYGSVVQQATGLPASDGLNPGVLPNGNIRTMPPPTPELANQASTQNNTGYVALVTDGAWQNAPAGTAEALYNVQTLETGGYAKPEVLPAFTSEMLSAIRQGFSIDNMLGAAAAGGNDVWSYGGTAVLSGYRLPVSAWNYYFQNFKPGYPIPRQNVSDVVTVEEYWERRAGSGVSGLSGFYRGLANCH